MNQIIWERHQNIINPNSQRTYKQKRRWLTAMSSLLSIAVFFVVALLFCEQNSLLYKSNLFSEEKLKEIFYATQRATGNKIELYKSIKIESEVFKVYRVESSPENKNVVLFHGSRISPKKHLEIAIKLANMKYNVILPFYRGYGPSTGDTNEIKTMIDMRCLLEVLKPQLEGIYVVAQSHGCAVAAYFDQISGYKVKKMVLENPFYNLKTVIKSLSWESFFWFLVVDSWDNNARIEKYNRHDAKKILILHGENDNFIKFEGNGKKLAEKRNIQCKKIPGAGHTDGHTKSGFFEYIDEFLSEN